MYYQFHLFSFGVARVASQRFVFTTKYVFDSFQLSVIRFDKILYFVDHTLYILTLKTMEQILPLVAPSQEIDHRSLFYSLNLFGLISIE